MESHFFPGDTRFGKLQRRNRCLWREDSFLLHLLRMAVNASLDLRSCLERWGQISFELREPPRTRSLQAEKLEVQEDFLS